MTTNTIPTDDEAAILARADEIRADRARIAAEECAALFKPLLALLASPAFQEVRAKVQEIAPTLVTYPQVYSMLRNLPNQMDLLGQFVPAEARVPTTPAT